MYLNRKVYIGAKYEHNNVKGSIKITKGKENKEIKINFNKLSSIEEESMYWRKANAIHDWFVKNVVEDEEWHGDDAYVSTEQLQTLLDTVNKVLNSTELIEGDIQNGQKSTPTGWEPIMEKGKLLKDSTVAKELLPTTEGFFFGSTDYDQYYWSDLEETKKALEEILNNKDEDEDGEYYYSASW